MIKSEFEAAFKAKFPELCNKSKNPFATDEQGIYTDRAVLGSWLFYKHRQTEVDGLQKRVKELEKTEFKLAQVKAILQNNPNLIESELIKLIERALSADQYISHRQNVEEALASGASLTKHKVDL